MEFVLAITMRPETMETGRQVAEQLRRIAEQIDEMVWNKEPSQRFSSRIKDVRGDQIGEWRFLG